MSGRTLTAGAVAEPETRQRFLLEAYQGDVEAQVWGCVNELWRLAIRRREIDPQKVEELEALLIRAQRWQFAHPDAPDVEERWARHRAADERYQALKIELREIDERAKQCRASLSRHWDRLKPQRQAALKRHDGWSRASSGVRVADDLWQFALRGERHPAGEPGF